ncbi:GNAT family N-acetyltransferase [Massilia violaceinigra]|uniref:GNAT family N-acetyltransferase n=1 Tax=Massilia violaceinigra TaxID=2045208 RepID=A0ABY4A2I6_9BURK|nr:GNAT family N-acetyltransferase [Massilia violaceinigra]UOD28888.1 GNAT family N-acetyltransferase [Massilia violaceinigra]
MFTIRLARMSEKPLLEALIARSGIGLADGFYTPQEAAAITRQVFGVDSALVDDGTYFAIEEEGTVVACGGWSRRATDFGGDGAKHGNDRLLDPATEPARIRAFFVDPAMARRGLGSMLLRHCMEAAGKAGFRSLELVSTMPGEPLYLAHGFIAIEAIALPLAEGVVVRLTRMGRRLSV